MLSLKNIANSLGHSVDDMTIDSIAIDSRSVVAPSSTLFVAITTPAGDGHRYIPQLYTAGVRAFIVNSSWPIPASMPDATFITCDDTLKALHTLARIKRSTLSHDANVIAITGSRGKTVVKEMLYEAISNKAKTGRSPRSYNSQIGVPLSIMALDGDEDIAIIEAGISQPGEMLPLHDVINPTIGIFTGITDEHLSNFGSQQELINEKLNLFIDADTIIYNADDTLSADIIANRFTDRNLRPVHPGLDNPDDTVFVKEALSVLNLPVPDRFAAPVATRLDIIEGVNNCKLILDRFTPDIVSLTGALDFLHRRAPAALKRTFVLNPGDFKSHHESLPKLLSDYSISRVISIETPLPADLPPHIQCEYHASPAQLTANDFSSEAILIKDSFQTPVHDIYTMLEAKQHETVLEVNLDAIVHNFNFFRSKLRPETGVICMLKAAGYGAGSIELARTLQAHGAAYLAVAVVDEGIELRRAGITMPIMVLNPRSENMKLMFDYHLEPEVYSIDLLETIISAAQRYDVTDYPIHIKLETGMSRLGFLPDEIAPLASILRSTSRVKAITAFSHLSCADDPSDDDYTRGQFSTFVDMCDLLDTLLPSKPKRHILNSTGIIRFPEFQFDFVRLGIGLYGIPTIDDGSESALRPVSTLSSVIISLKEWEAGRSIGYNRRTRLTRHSLIATIPIGYADGIDRRLGNRNGHVMIHDMKAPIVGNVCMDIMMVDVTDIAAAGHDIKIGDRVEIFGPQLSPTAIADTLGTIPYEILTSISPRVKRVYYRE